jgi:fumarylacetoacetate (FAA) hydrolase
MRLVTYAHRRHGTSARVGLLQGDRVLDATALLQESGTPEPPADMLALLDGGAPLGDMLATASRQFADAHRASLHVPPEIALPVWETTLLAPLPRPRSFRDFSGFEQHLAAAFARRDRPVPPAWYEVPVFSFGHTGNIVGPDGPVPTPPLAGELDFELELGCVIGTAGRDIPAAAALAHVAGYTVLNDWSARDLQRQEMSVGLGPAKGKDFAASLGPAIVTPDELADRISGETGTIDLWMTARINGEEVSRGNAKDLHWTLAQMIERASQGVELLPGDLIGSGTVGTGCLLELGEAVHPWLVPGDDVELEIERLGRLRNVIA